LRQSNLIHPTYAENFHCIGSSCEDTCCQGWNVPIDQATYEKYQNVPASPLRTLLDESVLRMPKDATGAVKDESAKTYVFAQIRMDSSNQCPMLTGDRLCRIQAEQGEALLSHACAVYPRIVHSVGGNEEKALTLSCPEAARLVLLNPDLLAEAAQPGIGVAGNETAHGADSRPIDYWAIRKSVLALVRNRNYPLWQRMFLLGVFCRRLDAIVNGKLERTIPEFLIDFEATVAGGAMRATMEALPLDRAAQLDIVLRMAGLMLHRSNVRPRFVECVNAFTAGIGNGPGATLESLTAHYSLAHDRYFEPYFRRHPHILENYLINTIIRLQFPFGKEGMQPGAQPRMVREYAMLTAQFALTKGLLIGVAGFHREAFSAANVVHTVQAAAKHFEHHPEFLNMAYGLLIESEMDGARGLAILLRNTKPAVPRPTTPAIHAPEPHVSEPRVGTAV